MKKLILLILILISVSFNIGLAQEVYNGCPMEGDAQDVSHAQLNKLKNRYAIPKSSDFDNDVTFSDMVKRGNDENRFSSNNAVTIEGFVTRVIREHKESCNCKSDEESFTDIHIYINATTTHNKKKAVVIEITPRLRKKIFEQLGLQDLKASTLENAILSKKVKVKGWLMFDTQHKNVALNSNPRARRIDRATCWEIHPITSMEIIE